MNIAYSKELIREKLNTLNADYKINVSFLDIHKICNVWVGVSGCFCEQMGAFRQTKDKCFQCNSDHAFACACTHGVHIYECYAGVCDLIAPIYIDGVLTSFLMSGKFKDEEKLISNEEKMKSAVTLHQIDGDFMTQFYRDLPTLTHEQITQLTRDMELTTIEIVNEGLVRCTPPTGKLKILTDYITSNLSENLSVARLCKQTKTTRYQLYQLLDEEQGFTPQQYVCLKRLEHACALIERGETLSEAARQSGFENYSYFSAVFHNKLGVKAVKYKQIHGCSALAK